MRTLARLPRRPRDSHKGDYGRVLALAGSAGMAGAAALAGDSALRAGAGLVTIGCPKCVYPVLAAKVTCCTTRALPESPAGTLSDLGRQVVADLAEGFDVLAVGPGLGRHVETTRLVLWLASSIDRPMVIDADGLSALAEDVGALNYAVAPRVLTPHPGEMARLAGLESAAEVQKNREGFAFELARRRRAVVALKGHRTVVTDGRRIFVNATGNPGMATGGAGDVLTGVIAGLLAQGMEPFMAAATGVHVHGLAGDIAARIKGEISLIATDIMEALPEAFRRFSKARLR